MTINCKKCTCILIALIVIMSNAAFIVYKVNIINIWRLNKAESLYSQAKTVDNPKEKVILFIESDFLDPNESKKTEISNIYLRNGDYNKAKTYLKRLNSQSGCLKYAEAALENKDYHVFEECVYKISDEGKRNELEIFKKITDNEDNLDKISELPLDPQTNLGIILKSLNTNDFSKITDNTLMGWKILGILEKTDGELTRQLAISNILILADQPILARILLNQIIQDHSNLTDAYILKAKSYNAEQNYIKALKTQLSAIKTKPADLDIYQTALEYARLADDQNEVDWLTDNIEYLKEIQNKKYCSTCGI